MVKKKIKKRKQNISKIIFEGNLSCNKPRHHALLTGTKQIEQIGGSSGAFLAGFGLGMILTAR